jgi:hypothetical protein
VTERTVKPDRRHEPPLKITYVESTRWPECLGCGETHNPDSPCHRVPASIYKRRARPRPKLPLTNEQRSAIFGGRSARITFPLDEECPVEVGYVHQLTANIAIEITGIQRAKDAQVLEYVRRDDRPRLLRQSTHDFDFKATRESFDEYGYPEELDPEVRAAAAEDSAFTTSPIASMPGEPEAVDAAAQAAITDAARDTRVECWEHNRKVIGQALKELRADPAAGHFSRNLKFVERQIAEIDSRINRKSR